MAHIQKLKKIQESLDDYHDNLQDQVDAMREANMREMIILKDTAQHMDRVLQMETRRRAVQLQKSRNIVYELKAQVHLALDPQFVDTDKKYVVQRDALIKQVAALDVLIVDQRSKADKIIEEWKSTSSESTQMLKAMVDSIRAVRITAAGKLRQHILDQVQQYKIRLEQWRVQSERLVINAGIAAKTQNKLYEGQNHQGFQGSELVVRSLDEQAREETSLRIAAFNNIVGTLGKCTELMQGSMLEIGQFIKEKKKDECTIQVEKATPAQ